MAWNGWTISSPNLTSNRDFSSKQINKKDNIDNNINNHHAMENTSNNCVENWGFPLPDLYKFGLTFLKEKEGKALHLSYGEKLQLIARTQQVTNGPYDANVAPAVGYLDVIGKDRRQAWQTLGSMSKDDAMIDFIRILDNACPLFRPYVEAHKRDLEERERLQREEEELARREAEEREQQLLEAAAQKCEEQERQRLELQRQQIQDALNQQTHFQFKAYAEQQFPGNLEQQAVLMSQLQEQHYQQYMQQVYQQQTMQGLQQQQQSLKFSHRKDVQDENGSQTSIQSDEGSNSSASSISGEEQMTELSALVKPASMWTRKDITEFKNSMQKEGGDSIIKVGHGETVTVRVPTHEDGTCLFWEFATDSYDIGFGVYFEWTKTPGTQVSVHISESEEEEEDDDDNVKDDIERGTPADSQLVVERPPMTVIIPVYRRDCHEEVYAGSHVYPGQGVYLLKFDNSYSLWRSKALYYRVYYTH